MSGRVRACDSAGRALAMRLRLRSQPCGGRDDGAGGPGGSWVGAGADDNVCVPVGGAQTH